MDKIIITDGGRMADGFTRERLDCTVRAVALARRLPYKAAHEMLRKAGRNPGHRFAFTPWMQKQSAWARHFAGAGTVRRFVAEHPEGNYIVRVRGHVFAVSGGIALDTFDISGKLCRVVEFWEVDWKVPA